METVFNVGRAKTSFTYYDLNVCQYIRCLYTVCHMRLPTTLIMNRERGRFLKNVLKQQIYTHIYV